MSDFDPAVAVVLRHEGGFQRDAGDRGNWTGGAVGSGELKGTKFGISAASYPGEDIEGMTEDRAREIYYRDFWRLAGYGLIADQSVATKLLDLAVTMERNGRRGPAVEILQRAIGACGGRVEVDGRMGTMTIAAANSLPAEELLVAVKREAVEHYRGIAERNPAMAKWLVGWEARARA
ncbi:MAG: hypothetical protein LAP21_21370 [Acidobacteriia bacterium]|nr:hypothetical protein [Terriglobia bacterium]